MNKRQVPVVMAIAIALALVGCARQRAQSDVLLPSMRVAWQGVRVDAEAGGAPPHLLARMDAALSEPDTALIRHTWLRTRGYAERGVDAQVASGDVSEAAAESLRARIETFGEAVAELR